MVRASSLFHTAGWGSINEPVPHLAACGDLFAVGPTELAELYSLAAALGYSGSEMDFIADGSWALADMLPSTATNFSLVS